MASKVSIVEFEDPHRSQSFPMQVAHYGEGTIVEQPAVNAGAGSAQSAAFAATTKFISIQAGSVAVYLKFGTNPTAVDGTGKRLWIGQTEYMFVKPGDKVAVIEAGAGQ